MGTGKRIEHLNIDPPWISLDQPRQFTSVCHSATPGRFRVRIHPNHERGLRRMLGKFALGNLRSPSSSAMTGDQLSTSDPYPQLLVTIPLFSRPSGSSPLH